MSDAASAKVAQNGPVRSGNDAASPEKIAISESRSRFESRNAPALPCVLVARAISPSMRSHQEPNTSRRPAQPQPTDAAAAPAAIVSAAPTAVTMFAVRWSAVAVRRSGRVTKYAQRPSTPIGPRYAFIRSGGVGRTAAYTAPVAAAVPRRRTIANREESPIGRGGF